MGRAAAEAALRAIEPWDDVETTHRADALAWIRGRAGVPIDADPTEFSDARWWDLAALATADPSGLDPHLPRFVAKLTSQLVEP